MESRYERGRSGDHLLTYFQCDLCHFRNIQGRDTNTQGEADMRSIAAIIRSTLDLFWRMESGTVSGNLTMLKKLRKVDREELGL